MWRGKKKTWVGRRLAKRVPLPLSLPPPFCLFYIQWPESESEVAQLCPTLCDPMDCSLPGSTVHGIFQARILEWVAISFSRRSQPRDWSRVSRIVGRTRSLSFPSNWILYFLPATLLHFVGHTDSKMLIFRMYHSSAQTSSLVSFLFQVKAKNLANLAKKWDNWASIGVTIAIC